MFGNPLQAEITSALRSAVRDAVTMAVELRAVSEANRQSLRRMVQVGETYFIFCNFFLMFLRSMLALNSMLSRVILYNYVCDRSRSNQPIS